MTFRVQLTESATTDIDQSYENLSSETPGYASRWYDGLARALRSLSHLPERCPVVRRSRKSDEEVRQLLYESHRILFRIEGRTVYVLNVRHTRRKHPSTRRHPWRG